MVAYVKFTIDKAKGGQGHFACPDGHGEGFTATIAPVRDSPDALLEIAYDARDPVHHVFIEQAHTALRIVEGNHSGMTTPMGRVEIAVERADYAHVTVGMALLPGEGKIGLH